jgi:hypothetical protein
LAIATSTAERPHKNTWVTNRPNKQNVFSKLGLI